RAHAAASATFPRAPIILWRFAADLSVARARLASLINARLDRLHGIVGQRFAELGHLLKLGLILRAGVLEKLGIHPIHILHGLARRQLLRHGEVFLEAAIEESDPVFVPGGNAVVDFAVHLRHRLQRGPVQLHEGLEAKWEHHGGRGYIGPPVRSLVRHALDPPLLKPTRHDSTTARYKRQTFSNQNCRLAPDHVAACGYPAGVNARAPAAGLMRSALMLNRAQGSGAQSGASDPTGSTKRPRITRHLHRPRDLRQIVRLAR